MRPLLNQIRHPQFQKEVAYFILSFFLSLYNLNNANGGVSWTGNFKILPFFALFKQVFAPVLKIIGDKLNILRFRKVEETKKKKWFIKPADTIYIF